MEHEHVTLQSSEDYQELFERFLSAAGISPAEFKAYLAASVPHCGALRTVKNGLAAETAYEGIFLSENSYIIMDTLRTPETRVSRQEMEEYLAVHNARLPAKAELKRFDAWKNSFRCVLAKVYSAENVPAVYCPDIPITPENYWTAETSAKSPASAAYALIAVCDEASASQVLQFCREIYRKIFAAYFSY